MEQKVAKPNRYLLTLSVEAIQAAMRFSPKQPFRPARTVWLRPGFYGVSISFGLLDQLNTVAQPNENLSDTVLRIFKPKESK
jgi:hypothetical protein